MVRKAYNTAPELVALVVSNAIDVKIESTLKVSIKDGTEQILRLAGFVYFDDLVKHWIA